MWKKNNGKGTHLCNYGKVERDNHIKMAELTSKKKNERKIRKVEWKKDSLNERLNEMLNEKMNEIMNERKNETKKKKKNMNEWMNENAGNRNIFFLNP